MDEAALHSTVLDYPQQPVYLVIEHTIFETRPPIVDAVCLVLGDEAAREKVNALAEDSDENEVYHAVQVAHPAALPPDAFDE